METIKTFSNPILCSWLLPSIIMHVYIIGNIMGYTGSISKINVGNIYKKLYTIIKYCPNMQKINNRLLCLTYSTLKCYFSYVQYCLNLESNILLIFSHKTAMEYA